MKHLYVIKLTCDEDKIKYIRVDGGGIIDVVASISIATRFDHPGVADVVSDYFWSSCPGLRESIGLKVRVVHPIRAKP